MTSEQVRRERVQSGSRRKRDLEVATGFRRSRAPEPKGLVYSAHSAAYHASDEEKARAKEAAKACEYAPFAYNSALLLMAEGKEATKDVILAQATLLQAANERFLSGPAEKRAAA